MTTTPTASPELPDLDKLEALARAATPGPWAYQEDSDAYTHIVRPAQSPGHIVRHYAQDTSGVVEANARFTAGANPAAVLALIALARRAQPEDEAPQAAELVNALHQAERLLRAAGFAMTGTASSQIVAAIAAHSAAAQQAAAAGVQPAQEQASTTRVTETKRAQLEARGYEVVGYVMQNSVNELCTLAHGRVEWLGKNTVTDCGTSAPGTPEAQSDRTMPGWERGIATVTLNGHQLREALDFINPDGAGDPDQLDNDLTFGIVQHKDDDGNAATGLCCWNDDTDGVLPLDSEPRAAQLDGGQGEKP